MKTGNRKFLIGYFLVTTLVSLANGFMNIHYGRLTDFALANDFQNMVNVTYLIFGGAAALTVFLMISNYIEKMYLKTSMTEIKKSYMARLFNRHRLSEKNSVYTSHLSNDADRFEQQYYGSLLQVIHLVVKIVVATLILAQYSLWFIVVVLFLATIFYNLAQKTSKPVKKEEKVKSKDLENYTNFIEETLDGFSIIKSHQIESVRENQFNDSIDKLKKQHYKIEKKTSIVDALNGAVQGVIVALLLVLGLFLGQQAGLTLGGNMVVFLLIGDLMWPLQRVTPLITQIGAMGSIMEDFDKVLNESEVSGIDVINKFKSLEFNAAHLGYDETLLSDVHLSIEENDKVLIIGPSGAGKSTILKTLLQEIPHLAGSVRMNGKDITSYDLDTYNNLISIVDQIGYIFSGTIQENITMLQNSEVDKLIKLLSLDHLDTDLTLMNNGGNVSGGERARLLLARALYYNKELVVCDEILSSLDSEVAKGIEKDILSHANTLINVSHIVFVDNLPLYDTFVIVDNGKVEVTKDARKVLEPRLEYDIQFN